MNPPALRTLPSPLRVKKNIHGISQCTVDENIIATTKMRNNFCYPLKMVPI